MIILFLIFRSKSTPNQVDYTTYLDSESEEIV